MPGSPQHAIKEKRIKTAVELSKIFCMDFTAEKNIYNLHGWQLGVTNKTRSQFVACNRDKIIN